MGVDVDETDKIYELVFDDLLAADEKIWAAIVKIQENNLADLKSFAKPLMQVRGEIHTEFMRPIYKKHPELAKKAGFGDDI